jgi:hypothetical protein
MCANLRLICRKNLGWLLFVCIGLMGQGVSAVTLTFDELNPADYINEDEDEGLHYLTNEYESFGLLFEKFAYVVAWGQSPNPKSLPNYVTGPGLTLNFVGNLPTYVSLFVGSGSGYKVGIDAFGLNGYREFFLTEGEVRGMGSDESTPYIPNQFVSFRSPSGISSIHLAGQADVYIDDLTFTNEPDIAAPESSTFILFVIGLLGLILCNRKSLK